MSAEIQAAEMEALALLTGLWPVVGQGCRRSKEGTGQRRGGGRPLVVAANVPALRPAAAHTEAQPQVLLDASPMCLMNGSGPMWWKVPKKKALMPGLLVEKSMRSDWKPSGLQCTSSELSICCCTLAPRGTTVAAVEAPGGVARQARGQPPPACRWSPRVAHLLRFLSGHPSSFPSCGAWCCEGRGRIVERQQQQFLPKGRDQP
ncbi:UNVERIFIED_CONTAM: hypothetical protein K2H54_037944 [Gekko kuhli]